MTSFKPRLNISRKGRYGDYHLIIQVLRDRQKREIYTPFRLYKEEFDTQTGMMIKHADHARTPDTIVKVNRYLLLATIELEELAAHLAKEKGEAYTAHDLAEAYRRRTDLSRMFVYADAQVSKLNSVGRDGTASNYTSGFRALEHFLGHRDLLFTDFTCDLVDRFAEQMKQEGKMPNTVVFYLRQLRVIYNRALKDQTVREDLKPFRNQSMKEEPTEKRAITEKVLQQIARADLSDFSSSHRLVRDLFVFSYSARGMAFVDMCYLKKSDIQGDYICYRRRKTKQPPLRIRLEKPIKEILQRYADPNSEYLFPMLRADDSYRGRRNIQRKLNKCIHELGVFLGFSFSLQFYIARHTWATLARDRGVEVSVISNGMGHTSEKTTRIYLAEMNPEKIDSASRMMMKCLK